MFTDAAKYAWNGESPYNRETYRYTPLISYLFITNIYWFQFMRYFGLLMLALLLNRIYYYHTLFDTDSKLGCVITIFLHPAIYVFHHVTFRGSIEYLVMVVYVEMMISLKKAQYDKAAIFYGFLVHLRIYPIIYAIPLYLF